MKKVLVINCNIYFDVEDGEVPNENTVRRFKRVAADSGLIIEPLEWNETWHQDKELEAS